MMAAVSGIPAGAGQLLGKRLGKFEILALLALGGTAEIYLARIGGTAGFEKYVVVKCLHDHLADDAEFVKMFLDEARLAAHLDHSNIVQTVELGQHDGRYYMVMEFLAGLSLAMIVRRAAERLPNNRIPMPLVLNILAQSCAGMHYAHEKAMNGKALNIVHRDISPQNLVISFEGVVKIVDFGIAKAEMRETRTRSGTIKGKFAYMSPEQCVANNVDRRTDVFALGVIAHELLTGERLFKRPSPWETYQAVMACDVKPPSAFDATLDPALDAVILRATARDKAERYPTAEAFGDALLGYLHHRGIGSGPGDVSRFFDAHFAQEIEEHSARMRELISGRDVPVDTSTSTTWGSDDAEGEAKRQDEGDQPARASGDLERRKQPSAGSLSAIDAPEGGARVDDDEMPVEHTRIESNPLGQLDELNLLASSTSAKQPAAPRLPAPGPLPLPAAPRLPASGPLPLPAAPPGPAVSARPPGMPRSGRFPDLADLPTMIAQSERLEDPSAGMRLVGVSTERAERAPSSVPPAATGFENAPTAPANSSSPALARTQIASLPIGVPSNSPSPNGVPPPGSQAPQTPQGYPMMNAQLSAQVATGATVFPSDHRGSQSHPPPPVAPQAAHPSGPYSSRNLEPGGQLDGYRQASAQPRVPDSGPGSLPRNGYPFDPLRASNTISPTGPQDHEPVHGEAGVASRVRAAPTWLLAILFAAALGTALALTVAIAKIIR
jgi:serine/threonine-protein kinase